MNPFNEAWEILKGAAKILANPKNWKASPRKKASTRYNDCDVEKWRRSYRNRN
jgi:hypothetical protein